MSTERIAVAMNSGSTPPAAQRPMLRLHIQISDGDGQHGQHGHVAGIDHHRRRQPAIAPHQPRRERHGGDEEQEQQRKAHRVPVHPLARGPDLDAAAPEGAEYEEGNHIGQHLVRQRDQMRRQFRCRGERKVVRQADVQHQQRHREGENTVAQGVHTRLGKEAPAAGLHPTRSVPRARRMRQPGRAGQSPSGVSPAATPLDGRELRTSPSFAPMAFCH
ncbi:hypothetical protein FHT36_000294 [Xanthobacter sp. SG618]|nr:hypothetical protein [Xanthobacter sp. SG618]